MKFRGKTATKILIHPLALRSGAIFPPPFREEFLFVLLRLFVLAAEPQPRAIAGLLACPVLSYQPQDMRYPPACFTSPTTPRTRLNHDLSPSPSCCSHHYSFCTPAYIPFLGRNRSARQTKTKLLAQLCPLGHCDPIAIGLPNPSCNET